MIFTPVLVRHLLGPLGSFRRVTGIYGNGSRNGKWEQEFLKLFYSSDSTPVRFIELYKPSH